jgi:hypothetical protein
MPNPIAVLVAAEDTVKVGDIEPIERIEKLWLAGRIVAADSDTVG